MKNTLCHAGPALAAFALMLSIAPSVATAQDHLTEAAREELRQRALQILEATSLRYRELETYRDVTEVHYDVVRKGDQTDAEAADEYDSERMSLSISNPDRIAFQSEEMELYADGTSAWLVVNMFGQYLQVDAPDLLMDLPNVLDARMMMGVMQHPALASMFGDHAQFSDLAPDLVSVGRIDFELAEGRQYQLIEGTLSYESGFSGDANVSVRYEISTDTNLIERVEYDFTEFYNSMRESMLEMMGDDAGDFAAEVPEYERFVMRSRVINIQINQILDDDIFSFTPDEALERVDSFDFGGGWDDSEQMALIDEPAPLFSERTLDGATLSLEDLRGKVVLLDFWAMWCMPCVQALPHFQTIHEHFDGQDVVVLGVNRDPHDSEDRLGKFLEDRNVTFRQILDFDGDVAGRYHVTGIPCSVLIDADGVIRGINVGFAPGKERELIAQIEAMLEENANDAE